MKPEFLIVGTMKSGTSTLSDYLALHKDIFIPNEELHFFNNDKSYFRGKNYYKQYFNNATENQIIGEKTPTYSYLEKVPKRIFDMNPDAKLIWIFREPVARAYSNYWHAVLGGGELYSFEKCIKNEESLMKDNIFRGYLDRSKYIEQVERYLEYFPIEQMHFVLFEELVLKPEETVKQTLEFLNVSVDDYNMPDEVLKSNQRKSLPRSSRVQYYSRKLLGKTLPFKVISKVNQKKIEKYPSMDQDLKKELKKYFYDYNDKLESITGKDLSKYWS